MDPGLEGFCVVALMPNPSVLSKENNMFLLGDTFLRNFYSVYDYENQAVQLAVNIDT